MVAPSDFQNFFLGPLRAPQGPSGMEKWLRDPWETPSPSARQIDCIFAMDYEQKCLRGLLKCSPSGRRTGPCKNAVILACGHRRGALGPPSADLEASNFFLRFLDFRTFFLGAWSPPLWPFPVAPRRPQEVSRHDPNHLWMQKSDFAKMLAFLMKTKGF